MKRVSIVVHGQVQGVGFRYFVQEAADQLKISGWTRNLANGDVEIEAQGDEIKLSHFIDIIKKGPALANVKGCSVNETTFIQNEHEFQIRH